MPADDRSAISLPELGASLGRIASPSEDSRQPASLWNDLRGVRLALATSIFEAAARTRQELGQGRITHAARHLSAQVWMDAWETAVAAARAHVVNHLHQQLDLAARASRMPRRKARALRLSEVEVRALTARLRGGGHTLTRELAVLERERHQVETRDDGTPWIDAVLDAGRGLEAAWLALEAGVAQELEQWSSEIEAARHWRRARWPLWTITTVLLLVAGSAGLMLGGYLDAPDWLRPLVERWWSRG